jgi:hypothetical protein
MQASDILIDENILAYHGSRVGFTTWLREMIWGHRIHDVPSLHYLFLEFLSVAESCAREDEKSLFAPERTALKFVPRRSLVLRNLLFNNSRSARQKFLHHLRRSAPFPCMST